MTERHERIAHRAYRIWEEAGRPEGQDAEHWAAAEAELAATAEAGGDGDAGGIAPSEPTLDEVQDTPTANRASARTKRRT